MGIRWPWWLGGSPIAEVATASLVVDQKSHLWRMPQLKIKHLKQGEEEGHREPIFHGAAVDLLADCWRGPPLAQTWTSGTCRLALDRWWQQQIFRILVPAKATGCKYVSMHSKRSMLHGCGHRTGFLVPSLFVLLRCRDERKDSLCRDLFVVARGREGRCSALDQSE